MKITEHKRNIQGKYGPTSNGYFYVSSPKHRRNAKNTKHNSKWIINENQEFEVFRLSRENDWFCKENGCLFSIHEDCKTILGTAGERIAKFPEPANKNDDWHGYPVKCTEHQDTPSETLLDKLEKNKIITKTTKVRIEKGKL